MIPYGETIFEHSLLRNENFLRWKTNLERFIQISLHKNTLLVAPNTAFQCSRHSLFLVLYAAEMHSCFRVYFHFIHLTNYKSDEATIEHADSLEEEKSHDDWSRDPQSAESL